MCSPFYLNIKKEVSNEQGNLFKLRCQDRAGLHKRAVLNGPTSLAIKMFYIVNLLDDEKLLIYVR